jgi:hypothetical protein
MLRQFDIDPFYWNVLSSRVGEELKVDLLIAFALAWPENGKVIRQIARR